MNGSFFGAGDILPVPQSLSNTQSTGGSTVRANAGIITTNILINTTNNIEGNAIIKGNSTVNGDTFYSNGLDINGSIKINGFNTTAIPVGSIMAYAGDKTPTGWLLCDGTTYASGKYPSLFSVLGFLYGGSGSNFNVPDLRGRITVGIDDGAGRVTSQNTLGSASGEELHTLTTAEFPNHNHNNSGIVVSGTSHRHNITTGMGTSTIAGTHTHLFTGTVGDHNHGINVTYFDNFSNLPPSTSTTDPMETKVSAVDFAKTGVSAAETSVAFGNFQSFSTMDGTHSHTLTALGSTPTSGTHSHTFTSTTSGGNLGHNNMQPYIVINYIIKY